MRSRLFILIGVCALPGCGSLLESTMPAPQSYVLRLPARTEPAAAVTSGATVRVRRPEPGPGLDSDRIALLRSDQRFDFYSASRWAAPAPDIVEDVILDRLRGSGLFSAVFDDASPYLPQYELRCGLSRFESDYTAGGGSPTAQVSLDCTFGRHRGRALLANFTARGSARAGDDRLGEIVAAFETAATGAMSELERHAAEAMARDVATAAAR